MSVVIAWLYNRCRGLVQVMVFHAAHNAPGNIFATVGQPPPGAGDLYYLAYTGIWILVSAMIVAYSGADLGSSGPVVSRSGSHRPRRKTIADDPTRTRPFSPDGADSARRAGVNPARRVARRLAGAVGTRST